METPAESSAPPPAAGRPPRPGQRPARATPAPGVMGAIRGAARTGLVGVARPRWAARRAERLPWWAAWAIYWVAWWALLAGLGTVEALQFAPPDAGPIELVLLAVYELNLERWTPSYPSGWEVLLAQLVVIQLAPVTLGWLLLGWDGREESRAASVWRSTRRLWGVMPHIAAVVVAATVLWGLLDAAVARAVDRLYSAEPVDQSAYGPIYADLPWWARYDESLFAVMVLVASVWSVTALLWAVAAGGWGGRCRWPAVCEGCGYNLAGLRAEGTCPECGRAIDAEQMEIFWQHSEPLR